MASAAQIAANRRNAQKSTGPRTAEGKRTSSLNAYKHGLTGQLLVMTDNQTEEYERFTGAIVDDFRPVGAMEVQLARSIADTHWRINRAAAIENNIFASEAWNRQSFAAEKAAERGVESSFDDTDRALSVVRSFVDDPRRFMLLTTYEMRLHRKAQADLKQLRELQTARRAAEAEAAPKHAPQPTEPKPAKPQNGSVFSIESEVPSPLVCGATSAQPNHTAAPHEPTPPDSHRC